MILTLKSFVVYQMVKWYHVEIGSWTKQTPMKSLLQSLRLSIIQILTTFLMQMTLQLLKLKALSIVPRARYTQLVYQTKVWVSCSQFKIVKILQFSEIHLCWMARHSGVWVGGNFFSWTTIQHTSVCQGSNCVWCYMQCSWLL